jgi:hypothetical protein
MPGILHFLTIAFLFHYHIDLYILPLYYLLRVLYKFYSLHSKVFVILDFQIYLFFYIFRCIFMSATKLRFSYSVKATPTVLFPKLPLFFCENRKKFSNSSPSQVAIYSKLGKTTPRVHLWAQRSAAHPCELEEVEGYKNNYVFLSAFLI